MEITKEEAQKELALRELARRKLEYFVPYVDPFYWTDKEYIFKHFHKQITDALERVMRWEIKKLMISVPPQHWKSTISSQRFPLFAHLKNPLENIVLASYSQDLSKWHLSKIRQLISGTRFNKLWQINLLSDTAVSYELKEWGTFNAVWVWWALTWKPVDTLIIDDVHKDRAEYESQAINTSVWDWYTSVALSRLHKDSRQVLVMTRWGEQDLFGRIIELEWEEWEVINIPVLEWDTTIFPERFPLDFITQKRKVMWERDFMSLYMWDPINEWWGDFKKEYFEYCEQSEIKYQDLDIISFLDPAISQKQEADNTALITIWINRANFVYLLEVKKGKYLPDEIVDESFDTAKKFINKWKSYRFWIETVQYQKMLYLEIQKQMRLRDFFFMLEEVKPMWEKQARIKSTLQPRYSSHTIIHPKHLANIWELETELLKFPNWKNDDMIDAMSGALKMWEYNNIWQTDTNSIIEVDYNDVL